jgi:hypothetical protein
MRAIAIAFTTFTIGVAVGSAEQVDVERKAPFTRTVCELSVVPPSDSSKHVQIRARLRLYAHSAVVTDDHCPDVRVLLDGAEGGPDMSFCDLNLECPLNTENFLVVATFIGVYSRAGENFGRLRLERIRNLERTRLIPGAAPNTSVERTRER